MLAGLFVVPAGTGQGLTVFLVHADDPGVSVVPQRLSDGDQVARLELDRAAVPMDRVLGGIGTGAEVCEWLTAWHTIAVCAEQVGTVDGALALTAAYAKTREQFDRPIATFQAVSQRLADGYIDVLGARLTMWQAAWKLSEGLPATADVAVAKLWAADAGHRRRAHDRARPRRRRASTSTARRTGTSRAAKRHRVHPRRHDRPGADPRRAAGHRARLSSQADRHAAAVVSSPKCGWRRIRSPPSHGAETSGGASRRSPTGWTRWRRCRGRAGLVNRSARGPRSSSTSGRSSWPRVGRDARRSEPVLGDVLRGVGPVAPGA